MNLNTTSLPTKGKGKANKEQQQHIAFLNPSETIQVRIWNPGYQGFQILELTGYLR